MQFGKSTSLFAFRGMASVTALLKSKMDTRSDGCSTAITLHTAANISADATPPMEPEEERERGGGGSVLVFQDWCQMSSGLVGQVSKGT